MLCSKVGSNLQLNNGSGIAILELGILELGILELPVPELVCQNKSDLSGLCSIIGLLHSITVAAEKRLTLSATWPDKKSVRFLVGNNLLCDIAE
jgi:hypothetical protein